MDSEGVHADHDPAEDESAHVQEEQALGGQKEVRPRHGALRSSRFLFSVMLGIFGLGWRLRLSLFNICISIGLRQGAAERCADNSGQTSGAQSRKQVSECVEYRANKKLPNTHNRSDLDLPKTDIVDGSPAASALTIREFSRWA